MAHLKDSIFIAAPVDKVHAFAADIKKWPTWYVGLGEAESVPKDNGTLVEVEMEYAVPGSVLGKVADRVFVERNQERSLHHTLENLRHLTEA